MRLNANRRSLTDDQQHPDPAGRQKTFERTDSAGQPDREYSDDRDEHYADNNHGGNHRDDGYPNPQGEPVFPLLQNGQYGRPSRAEKGLGTAANVLNSTLRRGEAYHKNYTNQQKGPATSEYYNNTGYGDYQQVGGLAGGDYGRLEESLQVPIQQQHNQAMTDINNVFGGNGLYGSTGRGMMSDAMAAQNNATQNALASATAQRYGLELQDRSQRMGENMNAWKAGAASADQQNAYNQGQLNWDVSQQQAVNDFYNQKLAQNANYRDSYNAWRTNLDELSFQRALQLAGMGNSSAAAQSQADIAAANRDALTTQAMWTGGGQLLGGMMSMPTGNNSSVGGDLFNTVSNWFNWD